MDAKPSKLEQRSEIARNVLHILLYLALPDDLDAPTDLFKLPLLPSVSLNIGHELGVPKLSVRLRSGRFAAPAVSVPIASVHENCDVLFLKRDVWTPR